MGTPGGAVGPPRAPPPAEEPPDPGYEPDWAVLSPPRAPPEPGWAGGFRLPLGELRGLRRGPPALRRPFLVLLPRGGPCPPPLHLPRGALRRLLRLLGSRLRPSPQDPRLLLLATPEDPPEPPPPPGLVTRLLQGPYAATVGGLSRLLGGPRGTPGRGEPDPEPEPPFEVIACVSLGPRPSPPRGPPVSSAEWGRGHDAEGRSLEPEVLRGRIFRGGLSPEVRARGWRRLLGLQRWGDPESPPGTERDDYFRMKLQWRSLSPGQLRRNSALRGYRERLERDLARAPPSVPPALLRDVLMTFCMFHFDLGYVRGMSELLAPLATVSPDEVEAFWGFCSVMEMVGSNFGPGPEGLRRQLGQLGQLVRVVNPGGSELLELRGPRRSCSQWLQFRFQRQLGLEGTRRLWEVLWTGLPCPNFHLLVTCALLELLGASAGATTGATAGAT
ncbi:TBC1 domain family member 17-like, partial [Aphelocoma coerulescens]|uniref:TBC1 domain family member 17-like n=1 Tax=Aphelocoma coerulescens TaxID=39617 RepID=UPI003604A628